MHLIELGSLDDPRLDDYRDVRDAELMRRRGVFMAEGRFVVRTLLERTALMPRSLMLTPAAVGSLGDALERLPASVPVYVVPQEVADGVAGFHLHRGCLAAVPRPETPPAGELLGSLAGPRRVVVVLEDLTNHDNVGGVFRNALALGASAVLLSPRCCDPLYRKAVRVSMGATMRVPWARLEPWPGGLDSLRARGWTVAGASTGARAVDLREAERDLLACGRLAVVFGSEGPGLRARTRGLCDVRVRVAQSAEVDSLNVATASGVVLHRLGQVAADSVRGG